MSNMLCIVVVLPLSRGFKYKIDYICLKLLKIATFDHRYCRLLKIQIGWKLEKIVYVTEKYVRTAMFSNRKYRFCISELSGAGKNHGVTSWWHKKKHPDKYTKTSQNRWKRGFEEIFFIWSLRFSIPEVIEYCRWVKQCKRERLRVRINDYPIQISLCTLLLKMTCGKLDTHSSHLPYKTNKNLICILR